MTRRHLPLQRVLHRPVLMRQGEREPVLMVLCTAALLASRMERTCLIAAALILFLGLPICRFLAKKDPQFLAVLIRAHHYRPTYPPRSRPYRVNPDPRGGWKAFAWASGLTLAGILVLWFVGSRA